ncbi:uncharacterized protein B0H18DRAFT_1105731 [Fomitopsis serialis]|uniref:uncharacterized protein n=1 Tax=Fomitopsis serialis TaxID=139415 RepID=UPI002007EE1E|nr:uncharacterized protein B0H18DRAFT_1105731 [Neoantrodia serialis]KAH9922064.1 hypothetical protein B0H18DRAFT_1105731 [Neoantrodia serialis]
MAFGLTIGTERATALQTSIQDELTKRGYSTEADPVMAEYITIMIINNKTKEQISSELEDLIGTEFDPTFVDWLFEEAAKGAPDAAPPAPEASTSTQRRESPPHLAETVRKPPSGPRAGAPLYQQAISQAIPSTSPTAQKRLASARSPSPTGHANKSRRMDGPPTGPRAMQHGGGGPRSLLDRMGPSRNGHAPFAQDDIQARIDNITNGSPDANMMMMGGGFPMGGMGGLDMAMGNPVMLQEMMMNQMALMTQMAGAMGMINGGFPMQQGMGGDMGMFNGGMNGVQGQQAGGMDNGRGRGRGRGGPRGAGRGRGGQPSHNAPMHAANGAPNGAQQAPLTPSAPAPAVVAPTPVQVAPPLAITPSTSGSAQSHSAFVPPERPQSPTLCKFGLKCTNALCRYSHPSPVATPESGVVLSNEACVNGKNCKDKDCIKAHVSPAVLNPNAEQLKPSTYSSPAPPVTHSHPQSPTLCRYGAACTRPNCTFAHPSRAPSNAASIPCKFGTACTRANCPFQHPEGRVLPTSFHRGLSATGPIETIPAPQTGTMGASSHHKSMTFNKSQSAAELEKKVKEMEEKKTEAEKAVAQAKAAAAGKKDGATGSVAISA